MYFLAQLQALVSTGLCISSISEDGRDWDLGPVPSVKLQVPPCSCWVSSEMGSKGGRLSLWRAVSVEWAGVLVPVFLETSEMPEGCRNLPVSFPTWGQGPNAYLSALAKHLQPVPVCPKAGRNKQEPCRNPGTWKIRRAKEARHPYPGDGTGCLPATVWLGAAPSTAEEVTTVKTPIVLTGSRDPRAIWLKGLNSPGSRRIDWGFF